MPHTPEQRRAHYKKPEVRARLLKQCQTYYIKNKKIISERRREYRQRPEVRFKNIKNSSNYYYINRDELLKKAKLRYALSDRSHKKQEIELLAGRARPDTCEVCDQIHRWIVFDHCHTTGEFRGWLCNRCNLILGLAKDEPILLEILAAYLRENERSSIG